MNVYSCAVGAADTTAEFVVMPESSMGKLDGSTCQEHHKAGTRLKVQVRSLDSSISADRIRPPQLIKIDVEGAEVEVLNGTVRLIDEHHPTLCIEFHSRALLDACCEILEHAEYHVELLEYDDVSAAPEDGVGRLMGVPR